jgi:hypothetical protein
MHEVSLFRLYVLRAMYMFIVTGLGVHLWPARMIQNRNSWRGTTQAPLGSGRLPSTLDAAGAMCQAPLSRGLVRQDSVRHREWS